jgi:hypothetical protein
MTARNTRKLPVKKKSLNYKNKPVAKIGNHGKTMMNKKLNRVAKAKEKDRKAAVKAMAR